MSEKENMESTFEQLNDEQKAAEIPYYVHQIEMARMTRINKRLCVLLVLIFLAFVGTNAGWIIYESQFETYEVEQDISTGEGDTFVAGIGDVNYGQNQTENQTPGAEK